MSTIEWERRIINRARKSIEGDELPLLMDDGGKRPEFRLANERRDAAQEAHHAELAREKGMTPIDDAAWQRELEWRARFDSEGPIKIRVSSLPREGE